MSRSAYIHIPFCLSKCKYCSFTSFTDFGQKDNYIDALKKEIGFYYRSEPLQTLYFGGGTPSVLDAKEIKEIIRLLGLVPPLRGDRNFCNNNFSKNSEGGTKPEITLEINPNDADENYLKALKEIGVNRLSFGAQSFDDEILRKIGRRHNSEDIERAVKTAKECGFSNISLDLIYGLPGQRLEGFVGDLEKAVSLKPSHISLYGLKIEEGSWFYDNPPAQLPDNDIQADMYLKAVEILCANGFDHYEISNFALPGYESKHNLNYWNCGSYYGFGVSAHGFSGGQAIRYSNPSDLQTYLADPITHETETVLSVQERLEEEIFLGLRKSAGINTEEINQKFNIDFDKKYAGILQKYPEYLVPVRQGRKLTTKGFLMSNIIMSEFLG